MPLPAAPTPATSGLPVVEGAEPAFAIVPATVAIGPAAWTRPLALWDAVPLATARLFRQDASSLPWTVT
jgi:hypothetical protein